MVKTALNDRIGHLARLKHNANISHVFTRCADDGTRPSFPGRRNAEPLEKIKAGSGREAGPGEGRPPLEEGGQEGVPARPLPSRGAIQGKIAGERRKHDKSARIRHATRNAQKASSRKARQKSVFDL